MTKEAVDLTMMNLATDFKAQSKVIFNGQVLEGNRMGDLSEHDIQALQDAAVAATDWMKRYDLAGPGGGLTLMDAAFGLFGDLMRAYEQAEYPSHTSGGT